LPQSGMAALQLDSAAAAVAATDLQRTFFRRLGKARTRRFMHKKPVNWDSAGGR